MKMPGSPENTGFTGIQELSEIRKKHLPVSQNGKVIFIVTHDFEFVCRTCSRVLHFDEGEMPDDLSMEMNNLPKLRELFAVSTGKDW